jgi:hypothetical protein
MGAMGELVVPLILAGMVLAYASFLVYIRLRAAAASQSAIVRTLIELWVTFILAVVMLSLARAISGVVPPSSVSGEIAWRIAQLRALPIWGQVGLVVGFLLTLGLFVHLVRTISAFNPPATPASEDQP